MSDRKRVHNTDNKDTNTIYIPREAKAQYNRQRPRQQAQQQRQQTQRPPQQQYQQQPQYQQQSQYQPPQYQQQSQYQPQQQGQQQYRQPQYQPNMMAQPYAGQSPQQQYQGNYPPPGAYPQQGGSPPPPAQYGSHPQGSYPPPQQPRQGSAPPQKHSGKKKKRSRSHPFFRLINVLILLLIVVFGLYSCTSMSLIKKVNYAETGSRSRKYDALSAGYVRSILLIGTDGRSLDERGRSDTMILMSLNSATDQITLISLMRDCYVEVPGYGWDKLNAAYSYGGAELLMDTIEHNFGVKIDDYVRVNFVSFANIVDSVGGIELDVSDEEAQEINTIMQAEVNNIMGDDTFADMLVSGGKLHLNGKQALSYARIRYVGNSDFERTERQRRVIELLMAKLKSMNPVTLSNVSKSVLPEVVTNMNSTELYFLSLRAPFLLGYERQQIQVPLNGTFDYYNDSPVGAALSVDFTANYNEIKRRAYSREKAE